MKTRAIGNPSPRYRALVAQDGRLGGVEFYSQDDTSSGVARMWHDLTLLAGVLQVVGRLKKIGRVYVPASQETLNLAGGKFCRTLAALSAQGVEVCVVLGQRPGVYDPQKLLQFVMATKPFKKILLCVAMHARNWDAVEMARSVGARYVTVDQAEAMRIAEDKTSDLAARLQGVEIIGLGLSTEPALRAVVDLGAAWCSGPAARAARHVPSRRGFGSLAVTAVAAGVLAACASAPVPAVPDGARRVPVNDPQRIQQLRTSAAEQNVAVAERSNLMVEVTQLRRQIADLQSAVKVLLLAPPDTPPTSVPTTPQGTAVPRTANPGLVAPAKEGLSKETPAAGKQQNALAVERTDRGAIFRVWYESGDAKFSPQGQFAEELLSAAKSGRTIEVHGRTDSRKTTDANTRVAVARAVEARRWLVDQGISADRIRARYSSAGSFLVDGDTDEAKALNRRVEIVIKAEPAKTAASKSNKHGA